MKIIELSRGQVALVDDEDYERVRAVGRWEARSWRKSRTFYATHRGPRPARESTQMHVFILGTRPDEQVDHINRDGLDNRKANLRLATGTQNQGNQAKHLTYDGRPTSSRFKGVTWDVSRGKWQARVVIKGVDRHLGRFENEEDAARAYDDEAVKVFGEYARPNFAEKVSA